MNPTNTTSTLLSESQLSTLHAAMDRIIPPDDFPGAWEAGAGEYLLRQLRQGDLQPLFSTYRDGLEALDAEARQRTGQAFTALSATGQDILLQSITAGEVQTEWATLQRFLDLLIKHTAEGYYSDPGNGGNHNAVSWKMVGFKGGDRTAADYDWERE